MQGAAQQKPPLVVMAHGLAGQKDMGLEPFAEAFVNHGLAVLLFDYRCFGGSDGEPRNWVGPRRHLQDWEAALAYARVGPYPVTLSLNPGCELAFRPGGWEAAPMPCCPTRSTKRRNVGRGAGRLLHVQSS